MPAYSLVKGIEAEYIVGAGKPVVRLRCKGRLKVRAAFSGTAQLLFHWVQEGKTQAWRFEPSMVEPASTQLEETKAEDGRQLLTATMEGILPAAGLLKQRMTGAFLAPAIHIDVPFGADVWLFLIRSPWFPLRLQTEKTTLSIAHESSSANASISPSGDGGLSADLAVSGNSFRRVSVMLRRTVGQFTSDELVGELETGTQRFDWKPIMRAFDLCLVTSGSMRMSQAEDLARSLGASISSGLFDGGNLQGDFVLCDGPETGYKLLLKGDLGLIQHAQDEAACTLAW